MATYPTNEVHHVEGENHNALYMVVGIILALMLAGFVFFYNNSTSTFNDTAPASGTTRVENTINTPAVEAPAAAESNTSDLRVENNGVTSSTTSTTTTAQ